MFRRVLPDRYADLFIDEIAKPGDHTINVNTENGMLFTNGDATAAVTFTLPPPAVGLKFGFLVRANQTMTIAGNNNIVGFNDAEASSLAFQTANQKIGGQLEIFSNAAGTKWYVQNHSVGGNTVTVA